MARDPRYDILFEPVRIGPVTARNRFFQVPHCNGMGYRDPSALAAMRGVKAEGGWAVVATEETEIHPSSDVTPYIEGRLWDDTDLPAHALMVEAVHRHGSLAAIELCHNGSAAPNLHTRIPPMGPSHRPVGSSDGTQPVQARRMDRADIADLRRWHREAVERSLRAGYDIVYVYAGHGLSVLQHFLSPRFNDRTDEYGGSLTNRSRLLREVLEDTVEAADGRAAVACRIAVDELVGSAGYDRDDVGELLAALGPIPDLWDFMVGDWPDDSVTSRFGPEGGQEPHVVGLRDVVGKPVVGVGRFTSPDTMVRMVRQGILDFIGAARPSIADPFLPAKIEAGRLDDIRECIGCNICVSGDFTMSPIRCTQNPSMGEEWRRGWHPEFVRPAPRAARVLVVGAGPAGLEAAMTAGRRGYEVVMAEATGELGGRVVAEAALPGLAAWRRVVDYRVGQLAKLAAVEVARDSPMTVDDVLGYGFEHVAVATGARWRADGVGRHHRTPVRFADHVEVLTPDDLFAGRRPRGEPVVVFDDDHYYLGGVLAELLAADGHRVTLVTPAAEVSAWTHHTMEQGRIHRHLIEVGVAVVTHRAVEPDPDGAPVAVSVVGEDPLALDTGSLVVVTARLPTDALVVDLEDRRAEWADAGLRTVRAVGDALAPSTIAAAVWDGRRFAEELDDPTPRFRREAAIPVG